MSTGKNLTQLHFSRGHLLVKRSSLTSLLVITSNTCSYFVGIVKFSNGKTTKPPYLSQGIDPSSDIFQRIKMKYVNDEDGIKKYFAATVIVDDFGDLFDERYFI
ncbi:hypothetical protein CRYUN_Cryun04dG0118400 [Craigia yunnanensis]